MAIRAENAYQQYLDDLGEPLSGGFILFTKNNDINTLIDIWADRDCTVPQLNAYPLDAAGRITGDVWIADNTGLYMQSIYDKDMTFIRSVPDMGEPVVVTPVVTTSDKANRMPNGGMAYSYIGGAPQVISGLGTMFSPIRDWVIEGVNIGVTVTASQVDNMESIDSNAVSGYAMKIEYDGGFNLRADIRSFAVSDLQQVFGYSFFALCSSLRTITVKWFTPTIKDDFTSPMIELVDLTESFNLSAGVGQTIGNAFVITPPAGDDIVNGLRFQVEIPAGNPIGEELYFTDFIIDKVAEIPQYYDESADLQILAGSLLTGAGGAAGASSVPIKILQYSDTQIKFNSGYYISDDNLVSVASGLEYIKDITQPWESAVPFLSRGAAPPAILPLDDKEWIYVFLLYSNGAFDFGVDTDSSGANILAYSGYAQAFPLGWAYWADTEENIVDEKIQVVVDRLEVGTREKGIRFYVSHDFTFPPFTQSISQIIVQQAGTAGFDWSGLMTNGAFYQDNTGASELGHSTIRWLGDATKRSTTANPYPNPINKFAGVKHVWRNYFNNFQGFRSVMRLVASGSDRSAFADIYTSCVGASTTYWEAGSNNSIGGIVSEAATDVNVSRITQSIVPTAGESFSYITWLPSWEISRRNVTTSVYDIPTGDGILPPLMRWPARYNFHEQDPAPDGAGGVATYQGVIVDGGYARLINGGVCGQVIVIEDYEPKDKDFIPLIIGANGIARTVVVKDGGRGYIEMRF